MLTPYLCDTNSAAERLEDWRQIYNRMNICEEL